MVNWWLTGQELGDTTWLIADSKLIQFNEMGDGVFFMTHDWDMFLRRANSGIILNQKLGVSNILFYLSQTPGDRVRS